MAKTPTYQSGLEKFNRTSNGINALFTLIFILLAIACVVPVIVVLSISLTDESYIRETGYSIFPTALSGDAYSYIAKQGTMILRALGVSLLVTVVGTALGVLLTTTMGYVISRPAYKLKNFLTWVVFIPMVFNGGLSPVTLSTQISWDSKTAFGHSSCRSQYPPLTLLFVKPFS